MKISVCSANPHKLAEMRALLPDVHLDLLAADYPPEDGATYVDNARIKARYGRTIGRADRWMLADDSGVEVSALRGEPGVQTARWAEGRHVERLLSALTGVTDRRARYVCELVCLAPDGRELRGTGVLEGTIAFVAAGEAGFGFDPLFVPVGETQTVAELGDAWKAVHSHRARAAQALRRELGLPSTAPPDGSATS